jgi:phage terminase large subunit GpA-like protein
MDDARARRVVADCFAAFAPPPRQTVSQWADEHRQLSSEASAEPGKWITARAEYQRGIMDAISDPRVETVVVMSSAQVGKTEIVNNLVGFQMHRDPCPILVLQPTIEMAQAWSKDRLAPMLRDTSALAELVHVGNRRDSSNTLLHKVFPGGHITMAGANSPASLASRPIRVLLCDEVDRYPVSAGTEGDPVNLARKRTTTFWNRKVVLTSTPTVKGASRIEMEFDASDKRRFFVPCLECGEFQSLQWANVTWPAGEPHRACYACAACGVLLNDGQRIAMIRRGEWRATAEFRGRAGFHLSELYSPWVTLGAVATAFVEAKRSPETLKTWVNTSLGETWEDAGEGVDETGLLSRREEYAAEVPERAVLLTAGVDVQIDRLEMEVVAWGDGEESWNVDYLVIHGDPARGETWAALDAALDRTYMHETGTALHITATGIDSGGAHTQITYDYCRRRAARRVFALKGIAGAGRPVVTLSRKQHGGGNRKVDLYMVGVDDAKGTIYSRLKIDEPGPGFCHFPFERSDEYFQQLTAERIVTRYSKGFPRREWTKVRARNEALDCRVYAYSALRILNPVWSAVSRRIAARDQHETRQDAPQAPPAETLDPINRITQARRAARSRRPSGGWATGWKR